MSEIETEVLARRLARTIDGNYAMVDYYIKCYLHVVLTKRQAVEVMRRALELVQT
jgi:hypothetical protein